MNVSKKRDSISSPTEAHNQERKVFFNMLEFHFKQRARNERRTIAEGVPTVRHFKA